MEALLESSACAHTTGAHFGDALCQSVVKESVRFSFPGCHWTSYSLFMTWLVTQKKHMSIGRDLCFLTVSFTIPAAVLLSQCTDVGGCWWLISMRASRSTLPALMFKKIHYFQSTLSCCPRLVGDFN